VPELRSALSVHIKPGRFGAAGEPQLVLSERPLGALMQIAGWRNSFENAVRPLMAHLGLGGIGRFDHAQRSRNALAFRIAPERVLLRLPTGAGWAELESMLDPMQTPFLDLSHSRTLVRVAGTKAPDLLARLMPIDFDERVFGPGHFVQSGIHTVSVLVHRQDDESGAPVFDIYMPRSFAVSLWAFITQTALPLGYHVESGG
jgi:sarcosine oxidase subunit gamma